MGKVRAVADPFFLCHLSYLFSSFSSQEQGHLVSSPRTEGKEGGEKKEGQSGEQSKPTPTEHAFL